MLRRRYTNISMHSSQAGLFNNVLFHAPSVIDNRLSDILQKYAVSSKENALLLAASQGVVEDLRLLVNVYGVQLNTLCQNSGLMPIELAFKHDQLDCVAALVELHQTKKVYSELVDLLVKYTIEGENYPYKELALARAMEASDADGVNLFIKKYQIDNARSLTILNTSKSPIIELEIYWSGYQNKEYKTGNICVSSFLINVGHEQFKVNLSAKLDRGAYLQHAILLHSRGASAVYPGDFGGVDQPFIITGLPFDPRNFLTVRYERLAISPFEILSTYKNVKMNVSGAVTTIKDKMRYRLHLFTTQKNGCAAELIELGKRGQVNSTSLLQSKFRQLFRNLFIMRLNDKNPSFFFPSNYNLKNSPLNEKINAYFDSFVESFAPFEKDMLARKVELQDIAPFISDMVGTYRDKFKQLLTHIYSLQFVGLNHKSGSKTSVEPGELANQYIEELSRNYFISSMPTKEDATTESSCLSYP